ncbi:hypothetical protein B0H14DRAFT_1650379 [Mycena olivaceomarginata]|nr:hypothetical protein B0H14DRAFT_1650379 [Mycena olivaceomarginata]
MARFAIVFLGFLSFLLMPMLLMRYYPDSAEVTMAVAAWIWVIDTYTSGVTAFCLCIAIAMSGMLVCDARQWLTRPAARVPSPSKMAPPCPPLPPPLIPRPMLRPLPCRSRPRSSSSPSASSLAPPSLSVTSSSRTSFHSTTQCSRTSPLQRCTSCAGLRSCSPRSSSSCSSLAQEKRSDTAATELEVAVGAPAAPVEVLFDDGVVDEKDLLKAEEKA